MNNGKKKKGITIAVCIIIAVCILTAVAVGIVLSSLIGKEEAKKIALIDAGLNESNVSALRADLEFDDGRFQYDVSFYSDGAEYEYHIQGNNGDIMARDIDGGDFLSGRTTQPSTQAQQETDKPSQTTQNPETQAGTQVPDAISPEEAKAAALADAGLPESDVTFTKSELDRDDGIMKYEIEFYYGADEYDYEIDAFTGEIIDSDIDFGRSNLLLD